MYFFIFFLYKTQCSSFYRCIRLVLSELIRWLATPGILCPVLILATEKCGGAGDGPEKGHKDDQEAAIGGKTERTGFAQP